MSNTTAQTASALTFGDVVWGQPVVDGKAQSRRKGIVLDTFDTGAANGYVVWWFGKGAASDSTTSLMFRRELAKTGDVFEFDGDRASTLAKRCYTFPRAFRVGRILERHAHRMLSIGVK